MSNPIGAIQGSENWGPRAQQYGENILNNQDEAALKHSQDKQGAPQVREIIRRNAPDDVRNNLPDNSHYAQPKTKDEVSLSPEALALLGQ